MEDKNVKTIDAEVNEETRKVEEAKKGFIRRTLDRIPAPVKEITKVVLAGLAVGAGSAILKHLLKRQPTYEDVFDEPADDVVAADNETITED